MTAGIGDIVIKCALPVVRPMSGEVTNFVATDISHSHPVRCSGATLAGRGMILGTDDGENMLQVEVEGSKTSGKGRSCGRYAFITYILVATSMGMK
jgi:hypothetical protein